MSAGADAVHIMHESTRVDTRNTTQQPQMLLSILFLGRVCVNCVCFLMLSIIGFHNIGYLFLIIGKEIHFRVKKYLGIMHASYPFGTKDN